MRRGDCGIDDPSYGPSSPSLFRGGMGFCLQKVFNVSNNTKLMK